MNVELYSVEVLNGGDRELKIPKRASSQHEGWRLTEYGLERKREWSDKEDDVYQRSQREIDCEGRASERESARGKSRLARTDCLKKWAQARHNLQLTHVTVPLRLP